MKNIYLFLFLVFISSCGGGGGGRSEAIPQNNPPTITNSTFTFSVLENQNLAFVLQASDPDGDSITFQITGGSDQSSFTINNSGLGLFLSSPDYENPSDANFDNSYEVVIRAFQDSNVQQPNEIDSGVSFETKPKNKKVFSFTVQYMNESEGLDSRMIFFFWEEEGSFKLRYLELIG